MVQSSRLNQQENVNLPRGYSPHLNPLPIWGEARLPFVGQGRVRGCHTEGRLSFIASRIIMGNKKTPETSKTFEELPFQK